MTHLFIINPAAGSRDRTKYYKEQIRKVCRANGADYRIEVSQAPGDCTRIAREAAKSGCIFEVNTGAISRGYRTLPYPHEELLYELKKLDAPIMVNADSHHADTLDCYFTETKAILRDVGFKKSVVLYNNEFQSVEL